MAGSEGRRIGSCAGSGTEAGAGLVGGKVAGTRVALQAEVGLSSELGAVVMAAVATVAPTAAAVMRATLTAAAVVPERHGFGMQTTAPPASQNRNRKKT